MARLVVLAAALASLGCERGSPRAVRSVDAGHGAPSSSSEKSAPSAASARLHPALAGKPPSYWQEQASQPSKDAALPDHVFGMKVRYDGFIRENSPCLCSTGTALCNEMQFRGLDWNRIPWAKRSLAGGREAQMTLRGVLTPRGLEVTEPPERLPEPKETVLSGSLPCTAPPGGFRQRHARIGQTDYDRLIAYAEVRTDIDLSHLWFHYHPHVTLAESRIRPPRPKDHVFVFRFVSNADQHRTKLEELWGGPICVVEGGLDKAVRDAISSRGMRLAATEGRKHGLSCGYMAGYFDGETDELVLGATTWNRKMFESWLSKELAGVPVRVSSQLDVW